MTNYGDKPFCLVDVKLMNAAGTIQIDLPAAQTLEFSERVKSDELPGDGQTLAVAAIADGVDWNLGEGGISLEAWGMMTGRTVSETGSTPNRTKTLTGNSPKSFPYFQIFGKVLGDGPDDIHCKIFKAKLMKAPSGKFENNKFFVNTCSGVGVPNESGNAFELVQNETSEALPGPIGSGS